MDEEIAVRDALLSQGAIGPFHLVEEEESFPLLSRPFSAPPQQPSTPSQKISCRSLLIIFENWVVRNAYGAVLENYQYIFNFERVGGGERWFGPSPTASKQVQATTCRVSCLHKGRDRTAGSEPRIHRE